jgi:hypothetical protein
MDPNPCPVTRVHLTHHFFEALINNLHYYAVAVVGSGIIKMIHLNLRLGTLGVGLL